MDILREKKISNMCNAHIDYDYIYFKVIIIHH